MKTIINIGLASIATSVLLFANTSHHQGKFAGMYHQQQQDVTLDESMMMSKIQNRLSELQNHYDATTSDEVATFMYQYNVDAYSQEELLANLSTTLQNFYQVDMNATLQEDVAYLYELELFAKDIYQKAYDTWGLELFNTVSSTQAFNSSIVKLLLDNYSIAYNTTPQAGVYSNETVQSLYDEYLLETNTSIDNSLSMGILVEEKLVSEIDTLLQNTAITDDVKIVYDIVKRSTRDHAHSFHVALGEDDANATIRPRGHSMDNGNRVVLKNTQLATKQIKKGWTMVSIPVTTDTNITDLLPEDANNSIIWTYDSETGWEYTKITLDENGTVSQSGYLQISPFEGFWIHSSDDFNISTYVPLEVQTAVDTNTTVDTPPTTPSL